MAWNRLLNQAIPAGISQGSAPGWFWPHVTVPPEHIYHPQIEEVHFTASMTGLCHGLDGFHTGNGVLRRAIARSERRPANFRPVYTALFYHKWWFDELYQFLFVRPVLRISSWVAACDKNVIDWAADHLALAVTACARWTIGSIGYLWIGSSTWRPGAFTPWASGCGRIQTGNLRQYIMLLALGIIALFVIIRNIVSELFDVRMVRVTLNP